MPTYEYRCPNGHAFELFQRMSEDPVATCPECGETAERQISGGAGFLFKGEGFYITDYRSDSYRKKAEAEKGGGAEKSGSGEKAGKGSGGEKGGSSSGANAAGGGGSKDKGGSSSSGGSSGKKGGSGKSGSSPGGADT